MIPGVRYRALEVYYYYYYYYYYCEAYNNMPIIRLEQIVMFSPSSLQVFASFKMNFYQL